MADSLGQAGTNPIEKVIEMLAELEQKIIKEGEAAQKVYAEFAEWCEETSKNLQFEIKTGKAEAEELKATIEKAVSDIGAFDEKIEELTAAIETDSADLKAATEIREKEHADFVAEDAELTSVIDMLQRAIAVLEKEMNGGASMMQLQGVNNLQ